MNPPDDDCIPGLLRAGGVVILTGASLRSAPLQFFLSPNPGATDGGANDGLGVVLGSAWGSPCENALRRT
jgi:hypothetical protein